MAHIDRRDDRSRVELGRLVVAGALDRDYSRSRAVLIGTWEYKHLKGPLPAVRHSLDRMSAVLTGGQCGWPADRLTVIRNQREPGNLPDQLAETFEDVDSAAEFVFARNVIEAAEEPIVVTPVQPRPVPPKLVLRPPLEIADAAAKMSRDDADLLFTAVVGQRSSQEVAALIEMLRSAGREVDVHAIVRAAAAQPPDRVLDLRTAFHALGLDQEAAALVTNAMLMDLIEQLWPTGDGPQPAEPVIDWVLQGAATCSDDRVAAAVTWLRRGKHLDHAIRLVELAAEARPSTPELASLLAALWPALGPDPVSVLGELNNLLRLVDALRHNGWPLDAKRLLAQLVTHSPDEVADTLVALASCVAAFLRVGSFRAADSLLMMVSNTYSVDRIVLLLANLSIANQDMLFRVVVAGRLLDEIAKADTKYARAVAARVASDLMHADKVIAAHVLNHRVTRRRLYVPWLAWTLVVAAGATLQWLLPQPWPWLTTTANAIGNVLSWGIS